LILKFRVLSTSPSVFLLLCDVMRIKAPSRLHMTLIDLNGSYGRSDGGIGLTLSDPFISLKGELAESEVSIDFVPDILEASKEEATLKITNAAERLIEHFSIDNGFHFTLESAYPPHSGLGSGTQFSLATGRLIVELLKDELNLEYDRNVTNYNSNDPNVYSGHKLGEILKRGGTSEIGIFSFDHGGFIVDGDHNLVEKGICLPSSDFPAKHPVLIGRYDFPKDWEIIVAIPNGDSTVTGEKEIDLFAEYCPVPKADVEQLSHLILMNTVPFLLEKDIKQFGESINQIQNYGFKHAEINIQPDNIKELMEKMREFGAYGVGMSSFGSITYGITQGNTKEVYKATKDYLGENSYVFITKAQNTGHTLEK